MYGRLGSMRFRFPSPPPAAFAHCDRAASHTWLCFGDNISSADPATGFRLPP